jgi:hypothetical protein
MYAVLADAAARVVMSYTLPISIVPGLGGALWPVTFVVLQVVTNAYCYFAGLNSAGDRGLVDDGDACGDGSVARNDPVSCDDATLTDF